MLRIELGAHQEHRVNHVARATDRTEVSADVIQLAAHEVDTAPVQAVSDGEASDSEGSESASDSDQNDPPSSLVADAEQYELMQIAYAAVGKDFTGQEGSNYWIQPIYQELLHSSSRYNATREGERKRPSSGLARVAAYPKPPKQRKPSASGTSFSDWIGSTCNADTLQVGRGMRSPIPSL